MPWQLPNRRVHDPCSVDANGEARVDRPDFCEGKPGAAAHPFAPLTFASWAMRMWSAAAAWSAVCAR